MQWQCSVCKQVFTGERPPVPCPVCGAGESAFVPYTPEEPKFRRDTEERFVIVGGGIAGLEAARAIRARNKTASVTLVCGEGRIPYNRPALSDLVAGEVDAAEIAVEPFDWYPVHGVTLLRGVKVTGIDRAAKTLALDDGGSLPYDKLCLCTGANAFRPITVDDGSVPCGVLRNLADAESLIHCPPWRCVVVGGGILGVEAALALRARGYGVTLLELSAHILSFQADAEAARRVSLALEAQGIALRTGVSIAALDETGAELTDGTRLDADFVLFCAGVRSEVTLARAAGLAVNRGVLVDVQMRTDDPDIYAAGDCAEYEGRVAGLWSVAHAQGQTAGTAMTGDPEAAYTPAVPATALEMTGVRLFSAGTLSGAGLRTVTYEDGSVYKKLVFRGDAIVGALLWEDVEKSAQAVFCIEKGSPFAFSLRKLL